MQYMFVVGSFSQDAAQAKWPHRREEIESLVGACEAKRPGGDSRDIDPVDGYKDSPVDYYDAETKRFFPVYYWY